MKELINLSLKDWKEISGIGETKAIQLIAAFEMGRRVFEGEEKEVSIIDSTEKILNLLNRIKNAKREHLIGIYLDGQSRLLKQETFNSLQLWYSQTSNAVCENCLKSGAILMAISNSFKVSFRLDLTFCFSLLYIIM